MTGDIRIRGYRITRKEVNADGTVTCHITPTGKVTSPSSAGRGWDVRLFGRCCVHGYYAKVVRDER